MRPNPLRSPHRLSALAALFVLIFGAPGAMGAEHHVPGDYPTIQLAIDAAASGDEVVIADGVWYEHLSFSNKSLILRSASGRPADCILDGGGTGRILFANLAYTLALRGLTLRNGSGSSPPPGFVTSAGGAVFMTNWPDNPWGSQLVIDDCTFTGNTAPSGAAIYTDLVTFVTIGGCLLKGNHAQGDPTVLLSRSSLRMVDTRVIANTGKALANYTDAGVIAFRNSKDTSTFSDCFFFGNEAPAIGHRHGFPSAGLSTVSEVRNCTFLDGDYAFEGYTPDISTFVVRNSILWMDDVIVHVTSGGAPYPNAVLDIQDSCVQGGWPGAGNHTGPPQFLHEGSGDVRLAASSPCRDAGDNAWMPSDVSDQDGDGDTAELLPFDVLGMPRVANGTVDMGCMEFVDTPSPFDGPTLYVDRSASGTGSGLTWADATTSLHRAVEQAAAPGSAVTAIHVAAGRHFVDDVQGPADADRGQTLVLPDGVALLGGFPIGGGSLGERDPAVHETVIEGDLYRNDFHETKAADNAHHVLWLQDLGPTATIDGFTIRGGRGDVAGPSLTERGGGFIALDADPTISNCRFLAHRANSGAVAFLANSSPQFSDCVFERNHTLDAAADAGALDINNGAPRFEACTFRSNESVDGSGGAIRLRGNAAPWFIDCLFEDNVARKSGGSIYSIEAAEPRLLRCEFSGNDAWDPAVGNGGAMALRGTRADVQQCRITDNTAGWTGGGIWIDQSGSSGAITSTLIDGNHAAYSGGGLRCDSLSPLIRSVTITGNTAGSAGGAGGVFLNANGVIDLRNTILANNTDAGMTPTPVVIESGSSSSVWLQNVLTDVALPPLPGHLFDNLVGVPGFVDAANGDYRLASTSDAIEQGFLAVVGVDSLDADDDGDVAETAPYDLGGEARVYGLANDLGAFEWAPATPSWIDLGLSLDGSGSAPTLVGVGTLLGDTDAELRLTDGPTGGALSMWAVSAIRVDAPFKGGTLVPSPDLLVFLPLNAGGDFTLPLVWPSGIPGGLSAYVHVWAADAGGPAGAVASNALQILTP